MCGIFSFFSDKTISEEFYSQLVKEALRSKHRGPDNTKYRKFNIFKLKKYLIIQDIGK